MAITTNDIISYKISNFEADATVPSLKVTVNRGYTDSTGWHLIDFQIVDVDKAALPGIFNYIPNGTETLYDAVKKELYNYLVTYAIITGTIV